MIKNDDKGRLRKLALSNRNNVPQKQHKAAGTEAAKLLMSMPEIKSAGLIMCYMSFRSELPTGEIVENLKKMGKRLCFPLCEKAGIMQAWEPFDENSWKDGYMGIKEPDPECSRLIDPEDIGIVICPMVAFDKEKRRMGYGGGYYDRYLPKCKNAVRIGLAFEAQRLADIPIDEFDQRMDFIVTEEKIY